MNELQRLLDEIISERDELIAEVQRLNELNYEAVMYGDTEHEFAETLMKERDAARKCAEEMRDMNTAEVDESKRAFPWPWEAKE